MCICNIWVEFDGAFEFAFSFSPVPVVDCQGISQCGVCLSRCWIQFQRSRSGNLSLRDRLFRRHLRIFRHRIVGFRDADIRHRKTRVELDGLLIVVNAFQQIRFGTFRIMKPTTQIKLVRLIVFGVVLRQGLFGFARKFQLEILGNLTGNLALSRKIGLTSCDRIVHPRAVCCSANQRVRR